MADSYSSEQRIKVRKGWGTKAERAQFRELVAARPPGFFDLALRPLLERYCHALVEAERAERSVSAKRYVGAKGYRGAAREARDWHRIIASLSVKLGLAASQTQRSRKRKPGDAGAGAADPGDWRGQMGVGARRDDDDDAPEQPDLLQ